MADTSLIEQPDDLRQVAFLLLVSVLHGTASFMSAALWFCCR